ncbi:hypothetical protein pb186bvf_020204 [Paramecium bursaria]
MEDIQCYIAVVYYKLLRSLMINDYIQEINYRIVYKELNQFITISLIKSISYITVFFESEIFIDQLQSIKNIIK